LLVVACCLAGCGNQPKTEAEPSVTPTISAPPPVASAPATSPSPSASAFAPGTPCKHAGVRDDFNGDGRSDLVATTTDGIGDGDTTSNTVVFYRTATGFDAQHDQQLGNDPVGGTSTPLTGFLDGDCYADIALHVGATTVIMHGSPSGVLQDAAQVLNAKAIPVRGYRLDGPYAVGDFNGDGHDDLVLLATKGSIPHVMSALCVMYGSVAGLLPATSCLTFATGMTGFTAVGDITGDHTDDLVIGIPSTKVGGDEFAGEVEILYGSRRGLAMTRRQILNPHAAGVLGPPPRPAEFGGAVALGDLNGDGRDDLIVGTSKSLNQDHGAATVSVYRGTASGITLRGRQLLTVASPGMPGPAAPAGGFGESLVAADFNGDGRADVAIGRPFLNGNGLTRAGVVDVLYGTGAGLSTRGSRQLTPLETGITASGSAPDLEFGYGLTALPSTAGRTEDLIVSAAHTQFADEAGGKSWIITVPGSRSGIDPARTQLLSATQVGADEIGTQFGS
jgi:hypothetical protein